jgi:hypothetical protein
MKTILASMLALTISMPAMAAGWEFTADDMPAWRATVETLEGCLTTKAKELARGSTEAAPVLVPMVADACPDYNTVRQKMNIHGLQRGLDGQG